MKLLGDVEVPDELYSQIAPYLSGLSMFDITALAYHLNTDSLKEFNDFCETCENSRVSLFLQMTKEYLVEYLSSRRRYSTELFNLFERLPDIDVPVDYNAYAGELNIATDELNSQVSMLANYKVTCLGSADEITIQTPNDCIHLVEVDRNSGTATYIHEGKRNVAQLEVYDRFLSAIVDDSVIAVVTIPSLGGSSVD